MEDVEAVTDSRRGQSTLTDFYPARKAPSQKITKPLEGTSKLSPSPRTSEQACSDPQAGKENDSHVCPPPPRTTPRFQSLMSRLQKNAKEFENGVPWQRFTGNVLSSARRSHGRIISRCIETVQFEGPLPDKFEGRPLEEPENESFAAGRVEAVHAVSVASSAFSKSVFLSHNPPNVPQPRNFKQAVSASCPETSTNASAPAGPSSSAPTLHRLDILSDVCSDHRRAERVDPGGGGGGSGEVPWPSAAQVMQGLDASNGGKRERDKMHRETEWRAPLDRPQSRPSHEAPSSPDTPSRKKRGLEPVSNGMVLGGGGRAGGGRAKQRLCLEKLAAPSKAADDTLSPSKRPRYLPPTRESIDRAMSPSALALLSRMEEQEAAIKTSPARSTSGRERSKGGFKSRLLPPGQFSLVPAESCVITPFDVVKGFSPGTSLESLNDALRMPGASGAAAREADMTNPGSPKLHMASMEASPPTTPKSGFNPPPDTELLYCYEKMGEIEGMEHCAYSEMYLSPTPTTQFRQSIFASPPRSSTLTTHFNKSIFGSPPRSSGALGLRRLEPAVLGGSTTTTPILGSGTPLFGGNISSPNLWGPSSFSSFMCNSPSRN